MNYNFANFLTILRLISIPFFLFFYYYFEIANYIFCFYIFIFSSLTDFLDGYYARKLNQISFLGTLLDPIADKLLIICSLIIISEIYNNFYISIPVIFLISREIIILFIRFYSYSQKNILIEVNNFGKIKTFVQLFSNIVLLGVPPIYTYINIFGIILLYFSLFLSFLSLFFYIKLLVK